MKRFIVIIFVLIFCLSLLISCQSKGGTVNKSEENKSAEALTSEEKLTTETKEVTSAKTQEKTQEYTQEENNDTTYPEVVIHPNVKMSVSKKSFKSDEAVEVILKDEAKLGFFYSSADFSLWTVDERGEYKAVELSGYGVPAGYFEVLADPGESSGYAYLKAFSGLESGKSYILRLDITDSFNACAEVEITIE